MVLPEALEFLGLKLALVLDLLRRYKPVLGNLKLVHP
jgi:hypothetical protein